MGQVVESGLLSAYAGRRVLVTGHTGFKGAWLSLFLLELGADIAGFSLPAEQESHFRQLGLQSRIKHCEGDIRDFDEFSALVNDFRPEFIFHLAAQSLVRTSYDDPRGTFNVNVGGSVNVLDAVRQTKSVKALIYVTSDKCYLNREWEWGYRENDRLGGRDPYSASKAAAELVFAAYAASFLDARAELGLASVRAGNVIGGGDWARDRIVPDCMRALRGGSEILLRSPQATRPWQHVLDCLLGYLLLGARLDGDPKAFSGSWNFGPDSRDIRTVSSLAERVVQLWGSGEVAPGNHDPAKHEAHTLHLSCEKAHRILDWHPIWDFDRTVQETVDWYRKWQDGIPAEEISQGQVRSFLEDAAGVGR